MCEKGSRYVRYYLRIVSCNTVYCDAQAVMWFEFEYWAGSTADTPEECN